MPWEGTIHLDDMESLKEFFYLFEDQTHLLPESEKEEIIDILEEADVVNWPVEIIFEELDGSKWEEWAKSNPDQARVIEQFLEEKK